MKRFFLSTAVAAMLVGYPVGFAVAQPTELVIIFVKADRNGDLVLSKAEFLELAIAQFREVDSDRDDMLEAQELGDLSGDPEFLDNDGDGNGALTLEEVVDEKLSDFAAADTDKDGALSFDEVQQSYQEPQ